MFSKIRYILGRKGQLMIFVIIAMVIVGFLILYILVINKTKPSVIDAEFEPIYSHYDSCIEDATRKALDLVGTQAGYVTTDPYIPGSEYAPFSNQLNFMGIGVPYWYYITANGLTKEKIPSKEEIQNQISDYVKEKIKSCDFEEYYIQGYNINVGESTALVDMQDNKVSVVIHGDLSVSKDEKSANKNVHSVEINSKIGKFYGLAKSIYQKEKDDWFLENYTVDILRLNAPVDGVDLGCSPKIWKTREVTDNLKSALEANLGSIKFNGNYYSLQNQENKYFVVDKNVDESVNILYSKQWSTKISIDGDGVDNELMTAETV
jgi:hypothetical protein